MSEFFKTFTLGEDLIVGIASIILFLLSRRRIGGSLRWAFRLPRLIWYFGLGRVAEVARALKGQAPVIKVSPERSAVDDGGSH